MTHLKTLRPPLIEKRLQTTRSISSCNFFLECQPRRKRFPPDKRAAVSTLPWNRPRPQTATSIQPKLSTRSKSEFMMHFSCFSILTQKKLCQSFKTSGQRGELRITLWDILIPRYSSPERLISSCAFRVREIRAGVGKNPIPTDQTNHQSSVAKCLEMSFGLPSRQRSMPLAPSRFRIGRIRATITERQSQLDHGIQNPPPFAAEAPLLRAQLPNQNALGTCRRGTRSRRRPDFVGPKTSAVTESGFSSFEPGMKFSNVCETLSSPKPIPSLESQRRGGFGSRCSSRLFQIRVRFRHRLSSCETRRKGGCRVVVGPQSCRAASRFLNSAPPSARSSSGPVITIACRVWQP